MANPVKPALTAQKLEAAKVCLAVMCAWHLELALRETRGQTEGLQESIALAKATFLDTLVPSNEKVFTEYARHARDRNSTKGYALIMDNPFDWQVLPAAARMPARLTWPDPEAPASKAYFALLTAHDELALNAELDGATVAVLYGLVSFAEPLVAKIKAPGVKQVVSWLLQEIKTQTFLNQPLAL